MQPGTLLSGRYRIESVLGQGGMGSVYLARIDTLGDKPVAIKEMRLEITGTDKKTQEAAVAQFRQEAKFLANLEHTNLVQVSDFFEGNGRNFLVMAYVKGQTLADMLKERRGAFPVQRVLEWAAQLTSVLHYLHTQNPPILFRDLKPSNIMQDDGGRIRLIDFGIARVFNPDGATATFLQGMGSAGYSPLEQYQGAGGTDPRSDIYSLGATMYHLLTNRQPPSPVELVASGENMPSPRRWNPTLPPALEKIILKMVSIRKDDRQASMAEVQAALQRVAKSLEEEDGCTEALGSINVTSVSAPLGHAKASPQQYSYSAPLSSAPSSLPSGATTAVIGGGAQDKAMWAVAGTLSAAAVGVFAFMAYNVHAGSARPAPSATPPARTSTASTTAKKPPAPKVAAKPNKVKPGVSRPQQSAYQSPRAPVQAAPQPAQPPRVVVAQPSSSPRLPDASVPQAATRRPKPQEQQPQYPTAVSRPVETPPQPAPEPVAAAPVKVTYQNWPKGRPKPGEPHYWNPPPGHPDHIAGAELAAPDMHPPPGATGPPPGGNPGGPPQGGQGGGGFNPGGRPPGY